MNEAERMLKAASHMREAHGPDHPRHSFWSAVADMLEKSVALAGITRSRINPDQIKVADAYLEAL